MDLFERKSGPHAKLAVSNGMRTQHKLFALKTYQRGSTQTSISVGFLFICSRKVYLLAGETPFGDILYFYLFIGLKKCAKIVHIFILQNSDFFLIFI